MNKKIDKRLNDMYENNVFDEDFIKIELEKNILNNILPYQHLHLMNLICAFKKGNDLTILDGSSTGLGKTYTAIATCSHLKLKPIIVCPLSVIGVWQNVCRIFNVVPLTIVNYELIRTINSKYYELQNILFYFVIDNIQFTIYRIKV